MEMNIGMLENLQKFQNIKTDVSIDIQTRNLERRGIIENQKRRQCLCRNNILKEMKNSKKDGNYDLLKTNISDKGDYNNGKRFNNQKQY